MIPARKDCLVGLLTAISRLLETADEPRWARRLGQLAVAGTAEDLRTRRCFGSEVLALFGGMESFNDLVLQDQGGVRPEQHELDRLRSQLFEVARRELA